MSRLYEPKIANPLQHSKVTLMNTKWVDRISLVFLGCYIQLDLCYRYMTIFVSIFWGKFLRIHFIWPEIQFIQTFFDLRDISARRGSVSSDSDPVGSQANPTSYVNSLIRGHWHCHIWSTRGPEHILEMLYVWKLPQLSTDSLCISYYMSETYLKRWPGGSQSGFRKWNSTTRYKFNTMPPLVCVRS